MVEASLIYGAIQTIGVLIGVMIAVIEIRHMRQTRDTELETRQAQLFMQFYDQFRTRDFQREWTDITRIWEWRDYDEFVEKYGPQTNPEAYSSMMSVGNYFDGVGMLVRRKLIDMSFVEEMFSTHIIVFWRKIAPIIKEARERQLTPHAPPRPHIWEMVEYLYDEVIRYEEEMKLIGK